MLFPELEIEQYYVRSIEMPQNHSGSKSSNWTWAKARVSVLLAVLMTLAMVPWSGLSGQVPSAVKPKAPVSAGRGGQVSDKMHRSPRGDKATTMQFVPREVVGLAGSVAEASKIAAKFGLQVKSYAYGVAVFVASDPQKVVDLSKSDPDLPTLSLNRQYKVTNDNSTSGLAGFPSSPIVADQWQHNEMDTQLAWNHLQQAGLSAGDGVVVADLDTGINYNHPAFADEGKISPLSMNAVTMQTLAKDGPGCIADDLGHGSHTAGIIAARDDAAGVYGVAPGAQIMMIKVSSGGPWLDDDAIWRHKYEHMNKFRQSDAVIVCNPGGVIGMGTIFEFGFMVAASRRVIFTDPPKDLSVSFPCEVGLNFQAIRVGAD